MLKRELRDGFVIQVSGSGQWYPFSVPGTAMDTYVKAGVLPDPYYRRNEYMVKEFLRNDFDIRGIFSVTEEERRTHMELVFHGIDTVADIFLNGRKLGHTENMHRTWRFPVEKLLQTGENRLDIHLQSAQTFIENHRPTKGREIHMANTGTIPGGQYLRKAHSMFGWDWGPKLPDTGIFRKIELIGFDDVRLGETLIRQRHEAGRVTLSMETEVSGAVQAGFGSTPGIFDVMAASNGVVGTPCAGDTCPMGWQVSYQVFDPEGLLLYDGGTPCAVIEAPRLWWPNGLGGQPLYLVKVRLDTQDGETEERAYQIGLRTVTVSRDEDMWGQEFSLTVNGRKIFARGANYIPSDCFYTRITDNVLERDVKAAVFGNFNCLRVWGGGYYPSDIFYGLCDKYGILVWQDLMYACNIYDLTPEFAENIAAETRDNLLRFRNHASLALICGNNEMETAWTDWKDMQGHAPSLKRDYLFQFEYLLPSVVRQTAPDTFYWPSSPSSGGSFDYPGDENRGDSHYWDVWHGQKPFEEYQNHCFRFCSEFGFQSLPPMKTIESFTLDEDRNLFSRVMESHQKNPSANGKILYYLSETFRYPTKLEGLVFLSQVLQGYAMKTAVGHWRRNRGRCMGSIYWQFNDNWPVASWSGIDYYGRYKALHYMAREFFAPVAGSIEKTDNEMAFWISNESTEAVRMLAKISMKTMDFQVLREEITEAVIPAFCARCLWRGDWRDTFGDGRQTDGIRDDSVFLCVEYTYQENGHEITRREFETYLPIKYLKLRDPQLKATELENGDVVLRAKAFVPYCMAESIGADAFWEQNAIALTDNNPVTLHLLEGSPKAQGLRISDVYHTYC